MDDIEAKERKAGDWVTLDVSLDGFTVGRRYQIKQVYRSELTAALVYVTFGVENDIDQKQYVLPGYVSACNPPK